MLPSARKILGAFALATLLAGSSLVLASEAATPVKTVTVKQADTQAALRDLWIGHIYWVRNVALETIAGNTAAAKVAEAEVVANATLIAASIEPYYGKAGSDALMELLVEHYGAVKAHIDATAAGDKNGQTKAAASLTTNAEHIADFLSGANPYLPRATVLALFVGHGAHHMAQDQQLKDGQYAQEAKTWAAMRDHMYVISDALAGAIATQFPEKFN